MKKKGVNKIDSGNIDLSKIILDISKKLYSATTFEEMGKILFGNLHELRQDQNPTGKLVVYDSEYDILKTVYKHELIQYAPVPEIIPLNEVKYFSKIAIETKKILFIDDSHSDFSLSIDPRQKLNPPGSLVFVPLYLENELIGIFSYASQPERSINEESLSVLETLSEVVGIVLRQIMSIERSHKSIKISEYLNRQLPNASNEYAVLLDANGVILHTNDKAKSVLSFLSNELIGKNILEIITPEIAKQESFYLEKVRSEILPLKSEIEYQNRWFQQTIYPIQDEHNNLLKIAVFILEITDQKSSFEKLKENQRELATIFTNLPGLAYRCKNDEAWTMEFLSQGCEDLTGYKAEELLFNTKLSYNDLVHPEDKKRIWSEVQEFLEKNIKCNLTYRIITKQNHIKWVYETATGIFDNNGNLLFIEGIVIDITNRRRSEMLKEILYHVNSVIPSKSNFNEFLQSTYKAINQLVDAKNCFVAIYNKNRNSLVFPLYEDKYSASPVERDFKKGKTEYVFKTGKTFIATQKDLQELVSSGEVELNQNKCKSWIGAPININDKTIGVFAIRNYDIEDCYTPEDFDIIIPIANNIAIIYERMQSEEERKMLDNRFKAIWEKSLDGLRLLDENGIILLVNDSFCKTVDLPREKLIGKSFAEVYPEDVRDYKRNKFKENLTNENISRTERRKITLWNEKTIWIEISNSIIEFEGFPKMVMSLMRDISQEKFLEEQLVQSQKMESIGRLAGGVAHDFNNILTVILGNSEMIKRLSKADPKLAAYADKIMIASHRGSDLAKQLLSFAKLNKQIAMPVDLNIIISETLKLLEHSLKKKAEIKKELDYSISKIEADQGNIQQVIMNIIINAKDAIEDKGTITIKTGTKIIDKTTIEKPSDLPDGNYVYFSISDTGSGIPENVKKHIFEPFFTTKDNSRGTGLGLAIVYGIIRSHNGFISVDSSLGIGTTFTIFLPASISNIKDNPVLYNTNTINGNFEIVLLVDDEELILEIGKEILSALSFYPITANNGLEALKIYDQLQNKISIIIIDQIMPDKNGSELAMLIKAKNPEVKIILSSGTSDQIIEEFIEKGVIAGFIQKPYKIEELSQLLNEVLKNE
jgi:PAS domain S-box-containing protein